MPSKPLRIFSRQGQVLYDSQASDGSWDGSFGRKAAPAGVYLYLIDYSFEKDGEINNDRKMGDLTLIR